MESLTAQMTKARAAKAVFKDGAALLERMAPATEVNPQPVDLTEAQAFATVRLLVEGAAAENTTVAKLYERSQTQAAAETQVTDRGLSEIDWAQLAEQIALAVPWLEAGGELLKVYLRTLKKKGHLDQLLQNPLYCAAYEHFTGDTCKEEKE
ncbi:MAG: hypothetical protein AAF840_00080 [Bacteroidota bacterium]